MGLPCWTVALFFEIVIRAVPIHSHSPCLWIHGRIVPPCSWEVRGAHENCSDGDGCVSGCVMVTSQDPESGFFSGSQRKDHKEVEQNSC